MCPLSCAYSTTLFAWLHLFSTSFDELNRELEALLTQLDGVAIPVKAAEAAKQAEEVGQSGWGILVLMEIEYARLIISSRLIITS